MKKVLSSFLMAMGLILTVDTIYPKAERKIPFEVVRSKVILLVKINSSRPFRIILDSGMPGPGVLLFKKELGKELNLESTVLHRVEGAGEGSHSTAIKVDSQILSIGDVEFLDQPVTILQNDTMSGFPTDGVMGNTIFGPHAVRFDFERRIISLMEPGFFTPDSSWETMDMTFNDHGIPFIQVFVSIKGEEEIPLHVYIDSASRESLELLVRPDQKFRLPENLETRYLGRGLSGDISGQYGQVKSLRLGSFILKDVPTAFPKAAVRSRQPGADGIICNGTLLRFHVVFDFSLGKLYLKQRNSCL